MANPAQAKEEKKVKRPTQQKRQIQNEKRRVMNKAVRTRAKSSAKMCTELATSQDVAKKQEALDQFFSLVDKAAKKGIFKKNKASRMKSRMASKFSS